MVRIVDRVRGILEHPEQTQISLGVIAFVVLIFGFWYLRTSIRVPFAPPPPEEPSGLATSAGNTGTAGEDRTLDTDRDGLPDYDETRLYRSSPYLKDTDSDGYDDKTEVTSGFDPNCPKGESCLRSSSVAGTTPPSAADLGLGATENGVTPTADQIRVLLKQGGVSDEILASYDDATLVQLYEQLASESQAAGPGAAPPAPGTSTSDKPPVLTPEQKQAMLKMTPAQLRALFIQGGASQEVLDQVDDATLQAIVKQQFSN